MRYHVTLGERTFEVDLAEDGVRVDGQSVSAELRRLPGTPVHHLLAGGLSHTVVASAGAGVGTWTLHLDGRRLEAEVVDERTRAIREMTGAGAGPKGPRPVRAPMPGMVVRIEVEVGQNVAAGQGVVIIEAMKMENELKAEGGGIVAAVHARAGHAVEKGAVLVEFEAERESA
ncbi:MAG TPA: biotin/lipoyl-containing protein [Longimicrobiales bacterium]|nr:biotin/lipoyl-containing protein [Longimicrobiales bacterium]